MNSQTKVHPQFRFLKCHDITVNFPAIIGIVNVTPDSFYDGNKYFRVSEAIRHGIKLYDEGADIIDIGGESTRPHADPVPVYQEINRIVPVIKELASQITIPISIDTSHPEVMEAAVSAGASLINDVRALTSAGALNMAKDLDVPVCLMHMKGTPQCMQNAPDYIDVVSEVYAFLEKRTQDCIGAGIHKNKILIDPGFGFGKKLNHNLTLLRQLADFKKLGFPILVGLSRKSMIGQVLGLNAADRLYGSLSAALMAFLAGASLLRVHDVRATKEAIKMAQGVIKKDDINEV